MISSDLRRVYRRITSILSIGAALATVAAWQGAARAAPRELTIQGFLTTVDGAPASGAFTIEVALYASATAPVAYWMEERDVSVYGGEFDAVLGADVGNPLTIAMFADHDGAWLGVRLVAGPGVPAQGEPELPRRPLTAAPYAFVAGDAAHADSADGVACAQCIAIGHLAFDPATQAELDQLRVDQTYTAAPLGGLVLVGKAFSAAFATAGGDQGSGSTVARGDHVHDGRYFTKTELSASGGTLNAGTNPIDWSRLKGVPSTLTDGDQDTTYGAQSAGGLVLAGTEFAADFVDAGGDAGTGTKVARGDHMHDGRYFTKTELSASGGTLNAGTNPIDWSRLKGVPPTLTDGDQDTTYGAQSAGGLVLAGTEFAADFVDAGGDAGTGTKVARGDHMHDGRYFTKTELSASGGTLNAGTNPIDWSRLKGVPPTLTDGDQDTTYGAQSAGGLVLAGTEFAADFVDAGGDAGAGTKVARGDHMHDGRYFTKTELSASGGTLNAGTNPIDWSRLKGVPPTLTDGDQDTTYGAQSAGGLVLAGTEFAADFVDAGGDAGAGTKVARGDHMHDGRYFTKTELSASGGTLNAGTNPIDWSRLKGVPPTLTDGDQDTTYGAQSAGGLVLAGTEFAADFVDAGGDAGTGAKVARGDHMHDGRYFTKTELSASGGTLNAGTNPIDWSRLKGVPPTLTDGDQDTTYGAQSAGGLVLAGTEFAADFVDAGGDAGAGTKVARGDHMHDGRYFTKTELSASGGTLNAGTNPIDWSRLKGVPSTLTDGDQNTTYGAQSAGGLVLAGTEFAADFVDAGGDAGTGTKVARGDHMHDGRYFTKTELSSSGTFNDDDNPIDWTRLKSVPPSLADGDQDTTYGAGTDGGLVLTGTTFTADFVDAGGDAGAGTKVARGDHMHDGRYFTKTELSSSGTFNDDDNPIDWTRLKSVPPSLADGDQDTTYGAGTDGGLVLTGTTFTADFVDAGGDAGAGTKVARGDHVHDGRYPLLDGRASGQTIYGGTGDTERLILRSTTSAQKGYIVIGDDGGNVLIGTSGIASPGNARVNVLGLAGNGPGLAVQSSTSQLALMFGQESDEDHEGFSYINASRHAGPGTSLGLDLRTGGTSVLTLRPSGRVGVGTIDPTRPFEVRTAESYTALFKGTADNAHVRIESTGTNNAVLEIGNESETPIHLDAYGNVWFAPINASNGRVGIGTTSPTVAKLEVNGRIGFTNTSGRGANSISTGFGQEVCEAADNNFCEFWTGYGAGGLLFIEEWHGNHDGAFGQKVVMFKNNSSGTALISTIASHGANYCSLSHQAVQEPGPAGTWSQKWRVTNTYTATLGGSCYAYFLRFH